MKWNSFDGAAPQSNYDSSFSKVTIGVWNATIVAVAFLTVFLPIVTIISPFLKITVDD